MPLIEARNLEKVYKSDGAETTALAGVSFSIEKGEFVAITGPSGSGKSTLLHILGFLDRASSGSYRFENRLMDEYSEKELAKIRNQKMGFIFQAFNLLSRTTVEENAMLPLFYSEVREGEWKERVDKAISSVGLLHRRDHLPSQLSGGEQQRAAIARALVNNAEVIFADEPTGNLDSKSGEAVMQILQRLNAELGRTIILITHEAYTAAFANRVITLHDGMIVDDKKLLGS